MAGEPLRCRSARCSLLGHRHHSTPPRSSLDQAPGRYCRARFSAAEIARAGGRAGEARRSPGLLHLLAGAGRRLGDRSRFPCARAQLSPTTHPIISWLVSFGKADRLVIAPQDLRTTDATRSSEIYSGRFVFVGKVVVCDSRSPFEITPPSEDWAAALFGFGWLRHLRAAQSGISRANARALVDEWITNSSQERIGWRSEVVARRIISWLSQAPLLLDDADVHFYRRFLRSLT